MLTSSEICLTIYRFDSSSEGFIAHFEGEWMNSFVPWITVNPDPGRREWVFSIMTGLKKEYRIYKNLQGTALIQYNFFNRCFKAPHVDNTLRMSRHWYDLDRLDAGGFAEKAMADEKLFHAIRNHRKTFRKIPGVARRRSEWHRQKGCYSADMWPRHPTGTYPELPIYENEAIVDSSVTPEDQTRFTTDFTMRMMDFIKKYRSLASARIGPELRLCGQWL